MVLAGPLRHLGVGEMLGVIHHRLMMANFRFYKRLFWLKQGLREFGT
jgi:hypothetical protein